MYQDQQPEIIMTHSARKSIKRATQAAARRAMAAHVAKMAAKGWTVDKEYEGDAGCRFECITYFAK